MLYISIFFVFICQLAAAQTPDSNITAVRVEQNTTLSGFLLDGLRNTPIGDGYIFVLSPDGENILGYSRTKPGTEYNSGCFQISNLPAEGEVLLVGFHPSLEQNLAIGRVTLRGKYQEVEKFHTKMSIQMPTGIKTLVEEQTDLLRLINVIPCEAFKVMNNTEVVRLPDKVLSHIPICKVLNEPQYLTKEAKPKINFTANYEPITKESADRIIEQYTSVPGGVTLEGEGRGIRKVKDIKYDSEHNAFVLDEDIIYTCPVTPTEMKQIFQSIHSDDRMGVNLKDIERIYGRLQRDSMVTINLKLAGYFLENIVFNRLDWLSDYKLSENYIPKENTTKMDTGGVGVYFNFSGYTFVEKQNTIELSDAHLKIYLIPLAENKQSDGGYLPDYQAIKAGKVSKEYEANIQHIAKNIEYYMKERILRVVKSYGEAAAFARALKRSGMDLNALSSQL
jgi:hypothetical protein